MRELLIESKGIKTDQYFIPPFEVREGELVLISVYGGAHYQEIKTELVGVFTGKIKNENIIIRKSLTYVDYFKESNFRRLFYPVRVGEYLKKNANLESKFIQKLYEIPWIQKQTKINELYWNSTRLLSLYATFSKTNNIVFEVSGQGWENAKTMCEIVRDEIKNGGAAILIERTDHLKKDCTKYIKIEWLIDLEEDRKVIQF